MAITVWKGLARALRSEGTIMVQARSPADPARLEAAGAAAADIEARRSDGRAVRDPRLVYPGRPDPDARSRRQARRGGTALPCHRPDRHSRGMAAPRAPARNGALRPGHSGGDTAHAGHAAASGGRHPAAGEILRAHAENLHRAGVTAQAGDGYLLSPRWFERDNVSFLPAWYQILSLQGDQMAGVATYPGRAAPRLHECERSQPHRPDRRPARAVGTRPP